MQNTGPCEWYLLYYHIMDIQIFFCPDEAHLNIYAVG